MNESIKPNKLHIKLVKIMEEKIIGILQDCKNGISVEICKDALLNLCFVSQRSELLIDFMKSLNGMEKHLINKGEFENVANRFLSINCG